MRILLIADFYWPYLGGVEQHVRTLAHGLAANGHDVTVATLGRAGLATEEMDGPVRLRRLTSTTQRMPALFTSTERPWAPPAPDPGITRQLHGLIREIRPQIVHGHDWLARSFLPLRRWSRKRFGTRFVTSLHYYTLSCAKKNLMQTVPEQDQAGGTERPCSGPGVVKCTQCATRHYGTVVGAVTLMANASTAPLERRGADAVIAVSRATADGNRVRHRHVDVVANFLPGEPPASAEVDELVARLPDGDFILFVGDLRPMKGLDVLLAAHASLDGAMPLVLIGKHWPDTPSIPAGVVAFDRWPNAAVLEAWRRCAIGVVPSVWAEPFGIVVIEAMAAGRPVIASRAGGIAEIIEHGVSGILVEPADVDALGAALRRLIDDPAERRRVGTAAQLRARDFSSANVIPQIEAIYARVTECEPRAASTST
jgi:glycosyltransferase involved in cell wall biosynthesis